MTERHSVVLFDGVCNICNVTVQFLMRHDRNRRFKFAAQQSAAGQEIIARHEMKPGVQDSYLLLDNGLLWSRSTAVLRTAWRLGGMWALAYWLMAIPRPLRDFAYTSIARRRYELFGRRTACMMPTAEMRGRLL